MLVWPVDQTRHIYSALTRLSYKCSNWTALVGTRHKTPTTAATAVQPLLNCAPNSSSINPILEFQFDSRLLGPVQVCFRGANLLFFKTRQPNAISRPYDLLSELAAAIDYAVLFSTVGIAPTPRADLRTCTAHQGVCFSGLPHPMWGLKTLINSPFPSAGNGAQTPPSLPPSLGKPPAACAVPAGNRSASHDTGC